MGEQSGESEEEELMGERKSVKWKNCRTRMRLTNR